MKSYRETITAGQPLYLPVGGRVLYIQNAPSGPILNVEFVRRDSQSQKVERVGKGFKAQPTEPFEGVRISTTVTQVVDFIITEGEIEIAFNEDESIIGNTDAKAVPVRTVVGQPLEVLFAGTVAPVLGSVTIIQATTVTNVEPVAVTAVAGVLVAAAAGRRGLRVRNVGANAVAIGGAGVTFANAAVVIQPGETWNENEAAPAAWSAICDAALASTLNVQTIQ